MYRFFFPIIRIHFGLMSTQLNITGTTDAGKSSNILVISILIPFLFNHITVEFIYNEQACNEIRLIAK